MTKPKDIIKRIDREAKRQGVSFGHHREGGKHTVYLIGNTIIPIPRHREVNEMTTEGIYKQCETELGKGWWRR